MPPPTEKNQNSISSPTQDERQTDLEDFTAGAVLETLTTLAKEPKKQAPKTRRTKNPGSEVSAAELAALRQQLDAAVQAHPEEVEKAKKSAKKARKGPSATKRRIIEAAVEVRDDEKPSAYIHPCIWKFPHRDPGLDATGNRVTYWEVGDERLRLMIQSHPRHGVPYGTPARGVLALAIRSAVVNQSREFNLGSCQKELLEKMGAHNNGQYIRALKLQLCRIFFSTITIVLTRSNNRSAYERINIFSSGEGGTDYWEGKDGAKWPETLVMSEDFYAAALETRVPIRLEAIQALGKSPLSVDIYLWLSYRMYRLRKSKKPFAKIPWAELQQEFGAGYPQTTQGTKNFKRKFKASMEKVLVLYHQAQGCVSSEPKHLRITPAPIATHLKSV